MLFFSIKFTIRKFFRTKTNKRKTKILKKQQLTKHYITWLSFGIINDSDQFKLKNIVFLQTIWISFKNILMKIARTTKRKYFKQEMLMNNKKKQQKIQIYNCLEARLYWFLKGFCNLASNILAHFWTPKVVYWDENQFKKSNLCHRNNIGLLEVGKLVGYF